MPGTSADVPYRDPRLGRIEEDVADDDVFHRGQLGHHFPLEIGVSVPVARRPLADTHRRRGRVRLVQAEAGMRGLGGHVALVAADERGNLDFARGDHADVDARVGERLKQLGGHARVRPHSQADDRQLRHVRAVLHAAGAQLGHGLFGGSQRVGQIVLRHGEARLRPVRPARRPARPCRWES